MFHTNSIPELKDVAELLEGHQLNNPELNCLRADASRYSVLLLQPHGEIEYCQDYVRNKNREIAELEFEKFLELGRNKLSDVVITPEYSCPWSVLERLILNNQMPSLGKLWVIGCESATPNELNALRARVQGQCKFIYDENFERSAGQRFLDPVCFLFRTYSKETKSEVTVAIVQFKTAPMGDGTMRFETDNMIRGKRFYKFKNTSANSISLICLICSDSLAYATNQDHCLRQEFQNIDPSLILHVQLNQKPRNDRYTEYRKFCLQHRDQKDIICLNWARNIKLFDSNDNGHSIDWENASASAIYSKSWSRNLVEDCIQANQLKGFYLTYWSQTRAYVGFLNFEHYAFLLTLTKVSQVNDDPAVQSPALPKMLMVFSWNQENAVFDEIQEVDSGAAAAFGASGIDVVQLGNLYATPLLLERLILLSCGEIRTNNETWPHVQSMASVILGNDESIRRLTFVQDNCDDAMGFRRRLLKQFSSFNSLRSNAAKFPKRLERFKNHLLVYDNSSTYSNLKTMGGTDELASALYLGEADEPTLKELHALLDNRLREQKHQGLHVDPSDLVIWYVSVTGGESKMISYPDDSPPKINDGGQDAVVSFTRTE
ncbi:MAG: hypothetical protein HY817_03855 [Candidatus Abawacabacteria bacterium]|nr:hypothetical protein [Candidatus Abawacabacteria bacterium]